MSDWPHLTGKLAPKVIECLPLASMSAAEIERVKELLVEIDRMEQRGLKAEALTREAQQDVANLDKQCSEIALNHGREIERLLVEIDRMEGQVAQLREEFVAGYREYKRAQDICGEQTDTIARMRIECDNELRRWQGLAKGYQVQVAQLDEAMEIACGSGKFANPRAAAERIVAAVVARAGLAALGGKDGKR